MSLPARYPAFIQAALIICLIAFAGIIFSLLTILVFRYFFSRRLRREKWYFDVIENLLTNEVVVNKSLHDGLSVEDIRIPLHRFEVLPLHKEWCRRLLVQRIVYYRRVLTGSTAQLLRKLYIELNLQHKAERQITSYMPREIVKGLNELYQMNMPVDKDFLLSLTSHHNRNVMEMARCACVKLLKKPFCFLKDVKEPILPWEKLELLRLVSLRDDITVPAFSHWISSRYHPSVVSFCIRAVALFQQFDAIPLLKEVLTTDDIQLKGEAINALGRLMAEEVEQELVNMYDKEPEEIKLEIIKAIGRIGSGRCLQFLERELLQSNDFEVQKNSARSIIRHKAFAHVLVQRLALHSPGLPHLIMMHSLNPLNRN